MRPATQTRLQSYVSDRNGRLEGAPYHLDGKVMANVICANNHVWSARVDNLLNAKSWCPECYGNKPKTIQLMQEVAEGRRGKCLSEKYVNNKTHLWWKCMIAEHEPWLATPNNIMSKGSWCPHCVINAGEELTRAAFQEALGGRPFIRTRRAPGLEGRELDGFCAELNIAFEYQGTQHIVQNTFFHTDLAAFESQVARDECKRSLCEKLNIRLFYITCDTPHKNIRLHVRNMLQVAYPEMILSPMTISDTEFYDTIRSSSTKSANQFERIKECIAAKGGQCLSTSYIGHKVPLSIRCKNGHVFQAILGNIVRFDGKTPRFCTVCAGTLPVEELKCEEFATARGYEYLGRERITDADSSKGRWMLRLKCPKAQHIWRCSWDNFKRGHNCGECLKDGTTKKKGKPQLSTEELIVRGERKNSQLVSDNYDGQRTELLWRCTKSNHQFISTIRTLEGRTGCMICKWNEEVRQFGLLVTPMDIYPSRGQQSWEWSCIICGESKINGTKTQISSNKPAWGKTNLHLCRALPPVYIIHQPSVHQKARMWLTFGRHTLLSCTIVRHIAAYLVRLGV